MNNEEFVIDAFRAILKRDPEPEALGQAVGALASGMPVSDFLSNLISSPEYLSLADRDAGFPNFTPAMVEVGPRRLWVDLSDLLVSRVCLSGNYEPHETDFVQKHLKAGDTFVDIGANIGWFTTLAATIVGDKGRVYAFEPRDQTRTLLARSIQENNFAARVTIHDFALSDVQRKSRLLWMSGTNNPGGSRLERDEGDRFDGMEGQEVLTRSLDDVEILGRVSLVKLDVEGGEANVLKGARSFLASHRPMILTEVGENALQHVSDVSLEEYTDLVGQLGYEIRGLKGSEIGARLATSELRSAHPFNVVLVPNAG